MPNYKADLTAVVMSGPGPYSARELALQLAPGWNVPAKDALSRVRQTLGTIAGCLRSGPDSYVYLPLYRTGAAMVQPILDQSPGRELRVDLPPDLQWTEELRTFFNPSHAREVCPLLELDGGPAVRVAVAPHRDGSPLPQEVLAWVSHARADGADLIRFGCVDGQHAVFQARADTLSPERRGPANRQLKEAAMAICRTTRRPLPAQALAAHLLARGVYHGPISPSPLASVLFAPGEAFAYQRFGFQHLPDSARHFARSIAAGHDPRIDPETFRWLSGGFPFPAPAPSAAPVPDPASFQIAVRLRGAPRTIRTIQVDGHHTLVALHRAIQAAYEWDDDHLWAFYPDPANRDWAIGPEMWDDGVLSAHEVTVADLDLVEGQVFGYLFDFGDGHEFECHVIKRLPQVKTEQPVLIAKKGAAPKQYPDGDGDDGW